MICIKKKKGVILMFFSLGFIFLQNQNQRMRLAGTSGDYLVQVSCPGRVTISQLPRTITRWILIISKDGKPTTFGSSNLLPSQQKIFSSFRQELLCFCLCSLPPFIELLQKGPGFKAFRLFLRLFKYIMEISPECSPLQAKQLQLSQLLLLMTCC